MLFFITVLQPKRWWLRESLAQATQLTKGQRSGFDFSLPNSQPVPSVCASQTFGDIHISWGPCGSADPGPAPKIQRF